MPQHSGNILLICITVICPLFLIMLIICSFLSKYLIHLVRKYYSLKGGVAVANKQKQKKDKMENRRDKKAEKKEEHLESRRDK